MPNINTSGPPITSVKELKLFGMDENEEVGWIFSNSLVPVADYAAGIEITQYNQLVRDENGEFWRVSGQVELPYVTTGAGIPEDDALVPVGDAVLRQDLASPDKGAAMVARGVVAVDSIADLLALPEGQRKEGLRYLVKEYHAGTGVGGGELYWDAASTATHNGGTVFEVVGEAIGRFVRRFDGAVHVTWFGAKGDGTGDDAPFFQLAIEHLDNMSGGTLTIPQGTYKFTTSVAFVSLDNIAIEGVGRPIIDFQVAAPFKFGDFTTDADEYFTQTSPTVTNLKISGIQFIPVSGNGFSGGIYAYANCISLSAVESVEITDCYFEDHHVAAIDIAAKSRNVTVDNCVFNSTEEVGSIYGVRPFCFVAPLVAFDNDTGQLLYPEPTIFHEYITVNNCKFYNIGRSILSWNVHNSKYTNNYFYKPTVRAISVTNWNFNILIQGNTHIAVDNTSATLSTLINIGTGSENILIDSEQFIGSVSGVSPNNLLKCVHSNSYSRNITIRNSSFEVTGAERQVVVEGNSEVSIIGNVFEGMGSSIVIAGGLSTSTYSQKHTIIDSNRFKTGVRTVEIAGVNAGGTGVIRFTNNQIDNLQINGIIAFTVGADGWILDMFNNKFPKGAYQYIVNFGGSYALEREDSFDDKLLHSISTGSDTSITLDYRDYHGRTFYISPNTGVSLTLSGITNARSGVYITIISGGSGSGGSVTLPQGPFRNKDNTDLVLTENKTASYVRCNSFWFEI